MTEFRKIVYEAVLELKDCSIMDISDKIGKHSNPISGALRYLEYQGLVELYQVYHDNRYWTRAKLNK